MTKDELMAERAGLIERAEQARKDYAAAIDTYGMDSHRANANLHAQLAIHSEIAALDAEIAARPDPTP
jgi:hypothetical protein